VFEDVGADLSGALGSVSRRWSERWRMGGKTDADEGDSADVVQSWSLGRHGSSLVCARSEETEK
jgi:hypothetical protein